MKKKSSEEGQDEQYRLYDLPDWNKRLPDKIRLAEPMLSYLSGRGQQQPGIISDNAQYELMIMSPSEPICCC